MPRHTPPSVDGDGSVIVFRSNTDSKYLDSKVANKKSIGYAITGYRRFGDWVKSEIEGIGNE
jgi:hypothetical protein